jgi:hypothetical protein
MKLNDELEQLLKNLHLNRILDIYGEQLSTADKMQLSEVIDVYSVYGRFWATFP